MRGGGRLGCPLDSGDGEWLAWKTLNERELRRIGAGVVRIGRAAWRTCRRQCLSQYRPISAQLGNHGQGSAQSLHVSFARKRVNGNQAVGGGSV